MFLIDCGATGNFVSSAFVRKHNLALSDRGQVSELVTLADGSQKKAAGQLAAASVRIDSYSDRLSLTATELQGYDVILGMPWLHQYNPAIDWRGVTISFVDQRMQRHVLRKSPTGAAGWRPPPFRPALNLISAQQLEKQYKAKQIETACLVWSESIRKAPSPSSRSPSTPPPCPGSPPPPRRCRRRPRLRRR